MSIDITGLSAKELDALINQAKKRRNTLSKRKPVAVVRRKLTELAKAEGYSITELFGGAAPQKPAESRTTTAKARKSTKGYKLGKVAPKYRNPESPDQTWAGRGKPPRWLQAQLDQGRSLDEFAIR